MARGGRSGSRPGACALRIYSAFHPSCRSFADRGARTLFVALKLEPYEKGIVLPHEETHPKAKADRLELMRATRSNPEPIYALYEDPDQAIPSILAGNRSERAPLLQASVPAGDGGQPDEHILYRHAESD